MNIGIVGNGYVGKATRILECDEVPAYVYDIDPQKCSPVGLHMNELFPCSFVFVCVPTPMNKDGSCDTSIVSSVIDQLKSVVKEHDRIVVRSTVPVGFCRSKGVSFMPEFLTEQNWENDFKNSEKRIVAIDTNDIERRRSLQDQFQKLFRLARKHGKINNEILHDTFVFCTTGEAETAKLTRNCFLATKVSFFNEIENLCELKKINYKTVAKLVGMDKRIGEGHTLVPGHDGKRGFGGTCFPKDTKSMVSQMDKSIVLKAVVERNDTVDRPERDWEQNKGRAVSFES